MLHRIGKPHQGRGLAFAASVLLLTSTTVLAQTATPSPGAAVSTREGNIFDHRDHQPTAADDAAAGIAPPGGGGDDVEKEVQDLLRETDSLDQQSEQQEDAFPAASPKQR